MLFSGQQNSSKLSYKGGLMVNSFNLSRKQSPFWRTSLLGILGWPFLSAFRMHCAILFWAYQFPWKNPINLWGFFCMEQVFLLLLRFLIFTFWQLNDNVSLCGSLWIHLFENFLAFLGLDVCFSRLGKISEIISWIFLPFCLLLMGLL